jgi:membrane peptidoglycan carboxypeptidase
VVKKRRSRKLNVYANLATARRAKKDAAQRKKAEYLATLPKHPVKRLLVRLHPKRVWGYWFSKKGGIMALKIVGVMALLVVLFVGGLFAYFRKDLDSINPQELAQRVHTTVTKYYDRRGPAAGDAALLWTDTGSGDYKLVVNSGDISKYMKEATVAIEDKDFYKHGGISVSGTLRALINNSNGGSTQGGSTLTQQLVKQVFFANDESQRGLAGIPRKIKEAILSIEVERSYDKDQILTLYLNESPYGGRRNGVESAAKTYFGVDAKNLDLAQSALLAAIPNEPALYDPYNADGQKALVERQDLVLDDMVNQGLVSKSDADKAKSEDVINKILPENLSDSTMKAPWFVQMVRSQLESQLGTATVGQGGLTVTTTLDQGMQNALQASFDQEFNPANPKYQGIPRRAGFDDGAATVEDTQTGQIIAMMGSASWDASYTDGFGQTNAALSYIQPGSTIKPLVYAQLMSQKSDPSQNIYGSGTVIPDTKTTFPGGYSPADDDNKYLGNIPIRNALALSRNVPAVKAMQINGVQPTLNLIHQAGGTSYCTQGVDTQVGLAAAIGGCGIRQVDHVNAYSTLARGGVEKPQTTILKVTNSNGQTIKQWQDTQGKKVIDPQVAYILSDILSDDNARSGLYGRNFPGLVVDRGIVKTAVKTGTSNAEINGQAVPKDIWVMSYNPTLTMGVWFGNTTPIALKDGNSSLPAKVINDVMTYGDTVDYAAQGKWKQGDWYTMPTGIQKIGNELYPSWYNKKGAQSTTQMTFDKVSKMLATNCTPAGAKIQESVLKTTDPTTKKIVYLAPNGYDGTQNDNAHNCSDPQPTISSITVTPGPGGTYNISVVVGSGKATLNDLAISVDGATISDQQVTMAGSYNATYTASTSAPTFTVTATATDALYYTGTATQSYP